MSNTKLITALLLILSVLFVQVGTAAAAPQEQDISSLTGTIHSITVSTDTDGNAIVLVELADELGNVTQTLQFSLEDAIGQGLVEVNPETNEVIVIDDLLGTEGSFNPALAIIIDEPAEESNHVISTILGVFFGEDASVIDAYHEDGYGFGVIAQALWMSQNYSGDASLTEGILQAKTEKDFEAFFEAHPEYLAEGEAVPTNWGQFKKLMSEKKNNLGSVVSDKANKDKVKDEVTDEQTQPGNGQDKNKNKDNGKGKDKSKGKGKN